MSLVLEEGVDPWEGVTIFSREEGVNPREGERERYRPSPRQYRQTYQDLIDRDGNHCAVQGCPDPGPYHIHHPLHDYWNWRLKNLQLMCGTHDRQENRGRVKGEREGERAQVLATTVHADEAASMEIIISTDIFPLYRAWLFDKVLGGSPTKKEAIYDGAMYLKSVRGYGSSQTTRRYLNELSAERGPFQLKWDPVKGWIVILRERKK